MKYRILDNNKIVDENYLRDLLFEYELDDVYENINEYNEGQYNLKAQLDMLQLARFGEFNHVLYYLSNNWSVDVVTTESEV